MRAGRGRWAIGAALALAAAAPPAQAATVNAGTGFGTWTTFDAAPGETNDVRLSLAGAQIRWRDVSAPVTARGACTQLDAHAALCPRRGEIHVELGDGADAFALGAVVPEFGPAVDAGEGDDTVRGHAEALEYVTGGPGDDVLDGGGGSEPPSPCPGFGACFRIGDTLLGDDGDDRLLGGQGDDLLVGAAGSDELRGGYGRDELGGASEPCPGCDADPAEDPAGADSIDGGPGRDLIAAAGGDDAVRTVDADEDSVDCGDGDDAHAADALDRSFECERLVRCGIGGAVDGVLPGATECVAASIRDRP